MRSTTKTWILWFKLFLAEKHACCHFKYVFIHMVFISNIKYFCVFEKHIIILTFFSYPHWEKVWTTLQHISPEEQGAFISNVVLWTTMCMSMDLIEFASHQICLKTSVKTMCMPISWNRFIAAQFTVRKYQIGHVFAISWMITWALISYHLYMMNKCVFIPAYPLKKSWLLLQSEVPRVSVSFSSSLNN